MSCVTCEPKSTMRILSWDAIAGSTAIAAECQEVTVSSRLLPPQNTDEKAVRLSAPRRHQQTLIRNKRGMGEKIGALAQHFHDIGRFFHGKFAVPRQEGPHAVAVLVSEHRAGHIGYP